MKKLKKVLLVCLFSFLCLGFTKVSAKEYIISYDKNADTYKAWMSFIEDYPQWQDYDYVYNIVENLAKSQLSTTYKMVFISFSGNTNGFYTYNGQKYSIRLTFYGWNSTYSLYYKVDDYGIYPYYLNGSNYSHLYNISGSSSKSCAISATGSIIGSCSSKPGYSGELFGNNNYDINGNLMYLYSTGDFETLIYTNINYTDEFKYYQSSTNTYVLPSGTVIGNNHNSIKFTDIYSERFALYFNQNKLVDLGTFENSNVITYKIKDEEVGTDKELKIKFTFLNQLDVNSNDINIYKYGSQALTEYSGTTCTNVNNDSVCEFNLKYNVYESNSDKLMFDFKFNNTYNVKVEDNSGNNGIYSNYKDVEFEYKLLDFTKMSGAVFYLRNYDNFEYMEEFLNPFEYAFGIYPCKDYGSFKGAITYGNDIRYKNTYLYKDNNNVFQYNFDNYKTINNIGMDNYLFEFDSSLLDENKYSAFVIENINYLGSLDTDNLPLYVYYNSSLFNYNKLNYSTNVNNGSTNSYISSGSDFNLIINGSQQTITGGVNSGHIFEFDEEIKVQYKNGLQYFKNKIIDMFGFVSDFYNTMPNKFQVAFSLIFVLLVGIALFRLLL